MRGPKVLKLLTVFWILCLLLGFSWMALYQFTPGRQAPAPLRWPPQSALPLNGAGATLLMALHPHCPCSRASLEELARTLAQSRGKVKAHVLFLHPDAGGEEWKNNSLLGLAEDIPELDIWFDENGEQAALFGSLTSGQVQIYGSDGKLSYAGGLTGSRGHAGDNHGKDLALQAILEGAAAPGRAEVYGCSLPTPGAASVSQASPQK